MNSFIEKIANGRVKVIGFILICVLFASFIAVIQPINAGPDENMKMVICKYISDNGSLPHGGDPAVLDYTWGISYGFTPITPYIFAGLFIKITSLFVQDITAYFIAARLVSVLCYGIFILFNIKSHSSSHPSHSPFFSKINCSIDNKLFSLINSL